MGTSLIDVMTAPSASKSDSSKSRAVPGAARRPERLFRGELVTEIGAVAGATTALAPTAALEGAPSSCAAPWWAPWWARVAPPPSAVSSTAEGAVSSTAESRRRLGRRAARGAVSSTAESRRRLGRRAARKLKSCGRASIDHLTVRGNQRQLEAIRGN